MYIIRDIFVCKPGQASKFAKMMIESEEMKSERMRVLTDMVSDYNQVIVETEADSLVDFERSMEEYRKSSGYGSGNTSNYHEMYYKGRREILRTVD